MSLGIFALHGFILSFILYFHQKGMKISNRTLGVLVFIFSLILMDESFELLGFHHVYPRISGYSFLLDTFLGPLSFLYSLILTQKEVNKRKLTVHLAFPLFLNVLYLPYHFLVPWNLHLFNNPQIDTIFNVMVISKITYLMLYQLRAIQKVVQYLQNTDRSSLTDPQYNVCVWFRNVMGLVVMLVPLVLFFDLFSGLFFWDSDYITSSIMLFSIYSIGYASLTNPWVYARDTEEKRLNALIVGPSPKPKYRTSPLSDVEKRNLKQHILDFMEREKPYLEPDLTFAALASRLNLPSHQLSQILNEVLTQNFYDFINYYRVQAVIHKIEDNQYPKTKILTLGLESGFNSKPTLNRAFKKVTGLSPSDYIKKRAESNKYQLIE